MRSFVHAALGLATLVTGSTVVARQWEDYTPVKGVWDVNAVEVDPNHVDDYLTGLKRTIVPGWELMKRRGMVDDYKVLVRHGFTRSSPSVLLMVHYTSAAAMEPDRERDQALEKELLAGMSEAEGKVAVAGYEKYRTFIDEASFGEIRYTR